MSESIGYLVPLSRGGEHVAALMAEFYAAAPKLLKKAYAATYTK